MGLRFPLKRQLNLIAAKSYASAFALSIVEEVQQMEVQAQGEIGGAIAAMGVAFRYDEH